MKTPIIVILVVTYLWVCRALYLDLVEAGELRRRPKIRFALIAQTLCMIIALMIIPSILPIDVWWWFLGYGIVFAPFGGSLLGGMLVGTLGENKNRKPHAKITIDRVQELIFMVTGWIIFIPLSLFLPFASAISIIEHWGWLNEFLYVVLGFTAFAPMSDQLVDVTLGRGKYDGPVYWKSYLLIYITLIVVFYIVMK